jgi:CHAT domain-containing protein
MNRVSNSQAYLDLANDLFAGRISERDVFGAVTELSSLDNGLLDELAQYSEETALFEPRRSWAIAQVAYSASNFQNSDAFIKALAAWYLGRAANHWAQPKRVTVAISRARRSFVKLNQPGWIAACDWQQNALSWTRPNFIQVADTLECATNGLENAGFDHYAPHCRLALAYTQILIGKFSDAERNIRVSEEIFTNQGDTLNQARCQLNYVSLLRRQSQFDRASDELVKLLDLFEKENSPIDIAKTYFHMAVIQLLRTDDLLLAISQLEQAASIFSKKGLDLWEAACLTNLGAIYMQGGQFVKAAECLQQSKKSFIYHGTSGLLADTLNDSGKLNVLVGRPNISIRQYKQAEEIHNKLGNELSAAIDIANCGEAYGYLGRHQEALYYLEWAVDRLKLFNNPLRSGTCEKYMALIWARLGQPALAHEHLDKAAGYYEEAEQKALISSIYNSRAQIYFEQGELNVSIEYLKKSLAIAETYNVRPQAALARRLLGEALLHSKLYDEAYTYLLHALSDFSGMGMVMDCAACLVTAGIYHAQLSNPDNAKKAFEEALSHSDGVFPEIEWRAFAGLAGLAEVQGDVQAEIQAYRQAINALGKVRRNLWQPSLVGSYLQVPSTTFDKAIVLAAKIESQQDALQFMEENKSITLLLQLSMPISTYDEHKKSYELNDIKAEIDWLQNQMRVSSDTTHPLKFALQSKQLRSQLVEKIKLYDVLFSRFERRSASSSQATITLPHKFDIARFRELAVNAIGTSWIALDYYTTADQLIVVVVTPDYCQVFKSRLSKRFFMVLEILLHAQHNIELSQADLCLLGDVLIPVSVAKSLTPDTHLLLVPHGKLHGIPWSAIQPAITSQPLVSSCIPNIVPSLRSLAFLWKRATSRKKINRDMGLLVGLSRFSSSRRELPFVRDEIAVLKSKLGQSGQLLNENDASWENLLQMKNTQKRDGKQDGLSRFAWLHIASHFFADTRTGRLSGIVLSDRDIWTEQLLDLAPLPGLITFSGCDSIYSYILEGDEHVGLPTTCFVGGADSVIGSLWPVLDSSTAIFMASFYDRYSKGLHPARSIAEAQREMINHGEKVENWASFICMGVP